MTQPPTRYRVLKERFVYRHGVLVAPARRQKRAGEFAQGDELSAVPCALLRRACRDGDLELVEQLDAGKRRAARATAGASSISSGSSSSTRDA